MNKNKIGTIGPSDHNELEVVNKTKQSRVNRVRRVKQYGLAIIGGVLIALIGIGGFKIGKWFETNKIVFHSPVEIQFYKPVVLVNRETYKQEQEMASQTADIERLAIEQYTHPDQLPKCSAEVMEKVDIQKFWNIIWQSESTSGKNKPVGSLAWKCEQKGEWNEIGFSPSTGFCFHSKKEAELYIPYYVSKNGEGLTLKELLCFYNTGHNTATCPYAEGNLSLAN